MLPIDPPSPPRRVLCAIAVVLSLAAAACTGADSAAPDSTAAATAAAADTTAAATDSDAAAATSGFLSRDTVHSVALTFDDGDFGELLDTYASTGEKAWMAVDVTIDGETYKRAGARLKGNSSLRSLSRDAAAGSTKAESMPWLIRLDKYVDGQNHSGVREIVVRSNVSATALNEAVALDLLREAGLASERAAYVRLSANGSSPVLRLVIENPADEWDDANFDGSGILYKAESSGDFSYRGDDPASYDEVFDQESGGEENLAPLIELLEFVNNSDDATFADDLPARLDVNAFATYLAFETLIDNFDDIDGPGNNSYLRWDKATDQFTVVAWDHNLAFGTRNMGGPGGRGGLRPEGGGRADPGLGALLPEGVEQQDAVERPDGGGFPGGGPMGRSNILVERFNAVPAFAALVDAASTELTARLLTNGAADSSLDAWRALLSDQAADLVDASTIASDAAAVKEYFPTS